MFYTIDSIAPICATLHGEGKKVVLATGFFDLLHSEHVTFLRKAKESGDILIVAVESDERARILKGDGRPVETQSLRCQKLLALSSTGIPEYWNTGIPKVVVDYVISLPSDFDHFEAYDSLMAAVKPTIYAVSSHTDHLKSKTFLVEKYGGRLVVVHDWNQDISTTQIIQNTRI